MGYAFFFLMLALAALMIPYSSAAFDGAVSGMRLFAQTLLPSLFPFLVCAHYLTAAGGRLISKLGKSPLSGLVFAVFTAICGTPSAAVLLNGIGVSDTKKSSFLCGFLNQAAPGFIIAALSYGFFGRSGLAPLFIISHCIPAWVFSFLFTLKNREFIGKFERGVPNPEALFPAALSDAVISVLRVGGTVVFFSVIHSIAAAELPLGNSDGLIVPFVTGIFEMTNGLKLLSSAPSRINTALAAFVLSFGGLCIFTQMKLIFPPLQAPEYFSAKLIHAAASFIVAWFLFPLFGESVPVFGKTEFGSITSSYTVFRGVSLLCFIAACVFSVSAILVFSKLIKKK
jgi:hypothetical protein